MTLDSILSLNFRHVSSLKPSKTCSQLFLLLHYKHYSFWTCLSFQLFVSAPWQCSTIQSLLVHHTVASLIASSHTSGRSDSLTTHFPSHPYVSAVPGYVHFSWHPRCCVHLGVCADYVTRHDCLLPSSVHGSCQAGSLSHQMPPLSWCCYSLSYHQPQCCWLKHPPTSHSTLSMFLFGASSVCYSLLASSLDVHLDGMILSLSHSPPRPSQAQCTTLHSPDTT